MAASQPHRSQVARRFPLLAAAAVVVLFASACTQNSPAPETGSPSPAETETVTDKVSPTPPTTGGGQEATLQDAITGRHVHVGRGAVVQPGAVLGDKTALTDYSRV